MGGFLLPFSGPSVGLYAAQTGRGMQGHMDGGKGHTGPLNSRHGKPQPVSRCKWDLLSRARLIFKTILDGGEVNILTYGVEVLAVSHIDFEREAV